MGEIGLIYESIDFATIESCDKSVNNIINILNINIQS